jgi:hypothetical protein
LNVICNCDCIHSASILLEYEEDKWGD